VDDEPFVNPQRMMELARAIAAADIDKEFFAYCRIDSMLRDEALMRRWQVVGLRRLFIGVETIFDRELKDYNKRQLKTDIVRGLVADKELGLSLFCNFIIHPSYAHEEFDEVIRFIRANDVDYPSFTIWTPIPGTGNTYDQVIERQPNGRPNWDYFDLQHPVTPTRLPRQEFMDRFNNFFEVFASKYSAAESPLFLQHLESGQDRLAALARRVLTLAGPPHNGG